MYGAFPATLWQLTVYISSALIFLLMGITIIVGMFTHRCLAMLIGIGAVLLTRGLLVYVLLRSVEWLPGTSPLPLAHLAVLLWGGLRGAATLALSLPL
jgi:monovalent cation:H+ antiporter, CPA1 family